MIERVITVEDLDLYRNDILEMFKDCSRVFDEQNFLKTVDKSSYLDYIERFVTGNDSQVVGIFDNTQTFLYGLVILDSIRMLSLRESCAEVHVLTSKSIFGPVLRRSYERILDEMVPFAVLYCHIPRAAVFASKLVKDIGFKKTGYIPAALPYSNSKGEVKMSDLLIYVLDRR